jgi:hypothetical protein
MRRRAVATVALLALAGVGAAAYVVTRDDRAPRPRLTSAQLVGYTDAVLPALRTGGAVVEQQMKPALVDFPTATGAMAAKLASDAASWADQLGSVREQVAAVTPPAELQGAAAGFDGALAKYIEAARQFRVAVLTPRGGRGAELQRGYTLATEADDTYDDASAIIQDWRRRLGLGATPDFPDPAERN